MITDQKSSMNCSEPLLEHCGIIFQWVIVKIKMKQIKYMHFHSNWNKLLNAVISIFFCVCELSSTKLYFGYTW